MRRVVVTGLGVVSPVGSSVKQCWQNVCNGVSGVKLIDAFDTSAFAVKIMASVTDFDVDAYIDAKEQRKMDPFIHYGIGASMDAIADAGLEITDENRHRVGVAIGAGIGGIGTIEENHSVFLERGPRRISPFFVPASIGNMVSGNLSIMTGARGPNITMVTACATGTHNIGQAARYIAHGDADVMIAGGSEYSSTELSLGGFAAARALSKRNDEPKKASRPWDKDRDGFVMGEGAGVLVLEEYEQAKSRGANIYAELSGFGMSGDAYHMTMPTPDGSGASLCMENALRDANLDPAQIDYVNAHGTSTPAGDLAETVALKRVFADDANGLMVSSTKSMTGHLLGAAGGLESVFSVLAIRDGVIPPTINLDEPGEGCDLDYVPHEARQHNCQHVMSNSFGFGGTNATLIFSRV